MKLKTNVAKRELIIAANLDITQDCHCKNLRSKYFTDGYVTSFCLSRPFLESIST